jgi:hypothetical protein
MATETGSGFTLTLLLITRWVPLDEQEMLPVPEHIGLVLLDLLFIM